ncbi:MAG: DMT family transporter [Acetobacterales bacterium]
MLPHARTAPAASAPAAGRYNGQQQTGRTETSISLLTALRRVYDGASANLQGIALMVLSALLISVLHAAVRYISSDIPAPQSAFFRSLFAFMFVAPFILRRGLSVFRTGCFRLHVGRGLVNVTAMITLHEALALTPLAVVAAISFTSPLWAVIGAILLFGEPAKRPRIVALAIGFVGTWVVLRPGVEVVSEGSLWMLTSAAAWSGVVLFTKAITRHDDSITVVAYMGLMVTLLTAIPAALVWVTPSASDIGWLVLIGFCHFGGQFCLAQSLKLADAGVVMPVDFMKLIWAMAFGFIVFTELPDLWTLVGGTVIFATVTWLTVHESGGRRAAKNPEES